MWILYLFSFMCILYAIIHETKHVFSSVAAFVIMVFLLSKGMLPFIYGCQ